MDLFKKPYEISLWEDVLEQEIIALEAVKINKDDYEPGKYYSEKSDALGKKPYELDFDSWDGNKTYYSYAKSDSPSTATITATISYYKEVKLCTIGSNTMDTQSRCINPKLVRKINGENTLTFTMYYRYVDNRTGEKIHNPFNKYMVNERKVKLRVGEGEEAKWYDFIIKNVQENSETCAFTYTCKDQFVNELSKTGFELVFDNELENNMGTVDYLAGKILEGSDWKVEPGDNLKQFVEEPLYKVQVEKELEVLSLEKFPKGNENGVVEKDEKGNIIYESKSITIPAKGYIYAFYSQINNQDKTLQFLYTPEKDKKGNPVFKTNDDLVIDKEDYLNYIIENVDYDDDGKPSFAESMDLSDDYRGMRLVRPVQTKYDSTIDKYVTVYEKGGEEYYGFIDTEYISPNTVSNYIVNPSAFTNTSGWYTEVDDNGVRATVAVETNPPITSTNLEGSFTSYLEFSNNGTKLMNTSIAGFRSAFKNGFVAEGEKSEGSEDEEIETGSKFVFRIKYKTAINNSDYVVEAPKVQIGKYTLINDQYKLDDKDILFKFSKIDVPEGQDANFIYLKAICEKSVSVAELKNINNRYGLFLTFNETGPVFIEDAQLFPYVPKSNNNLYVPGEKFDEVIKTIYKYYKPDPTWSSIDDLVAVDSGEQPITGYEPKYPDGATAFTKVRSISAKESNRYNLIQDLCEKFECWAKFSVDRNETTGEISMTQDPTTGTYHQNKYVQFQEYVGIPNHAGFRYGVNSKSIQRTLDSNAIISKMIVKDNANEFAPRGFCSIARASDNPTKENFLISFDHHVRQGLLNMATVTNDLYLDSNGYLGYYKKLKRLNVDRDSWIDLQTNLSKDIMNYEASAQSYQKSYIAAQEERIGAEQQIVQLVSGDKTISFQAAIALAEQDSKWRTETKYISLKTKWAQRRNIEQQHEPLYKKAETMRNEAQQKYDNISKALDELANEKRALNLQFYKKYSRFIQEGSWIKEDYVDDNLYYLDAESTLHTSTQPKVSYTINVIDLAQLGVQNQSDYSYYKFDLGDTTYIEDTEFFGWSLIDGKTPYREEIVVSEITDELDDPEKNVIKVQNYKTQFEDLFQRITAQTQQAEYHTGEFKRAANVVQPGGTISFSVLENSFLNNAMRLENARDQSVVIDEYGITSTSLTNPSEMVRIVAGGIFMSTDGGQTWRTGMTGTGINTSYLTAGQLNVDEIYIMSGSQPAFRWDRDGLSAYTYKEIEDSEGNKSRSYNLNKYVRFDQNGVYGRLDKEGEKDEDYKDVDGIMANSPFALTWKGFALNGDGSAVKITNTDDIQVFAGKGGVERIKIGRLDKDNKVYGLRLKDASGVIVMETNDKGQLWLKDRLYIANLDNNLSVQIGNLEETESERKVFDVLTNMWIDQSITEKEIINANNTFVVYKDGHMKALSGHFQGSIIADGTFNGHIEAESGSFSGELKAATGTFSGALEAATGTFSGALEAATGNFKGDISAASGTFGSLTSDGVFTGELSAVTGTIGGFTITQDGKLISKKAENEESFITLDGSNGWIYAKNITLGNMALIEEYIQLGNAYIRNPDNNNSEVQAPFIEANHLKIYDTGKIELGKTEPGQIILDGETSEIYGNSFSITPDLASFSNINCSGTIRTAVFEKGKVQGVGGAMLFKPSYKVVKSNYENGEFWLIPEKPEEEGLTAFVEETFVEGQYALLIGKDVETKTNELGEIITTSILPTRKKVQIDTVVAENGSPKLKLIGGDLSDFVAEIIIILGKDDISIGINSTKTQFESLLYPRGLTIAEIKDSGSITSPKLFLGDLDALNDSLGTASAFGATMSGYGLYCNNAYLQGALISAIELNTSNHLYAGINTNSVVICDKFNDKEEEEKDLTPIIFWGGASGLTENEICNSTFQVTAGGSLYAARAKFENSVIAGSEIFGSDIYAARIYHNSKTENPTAALTIYDSGDNGIIFADDDTDKEILNISSKGLSAFGEYFINLDSSNDIYFSLSGQNGKLKITDTEISIWGQGENLAEEKKSLIDFSNLEYINLNGNLKVYNNTVTVEGKAQFNKNISYGTKMEYRKIEKDNEEIGYDLYVS